ncbi:sushi, von Willebrand factor type A, EGF and pentraxin domain-containing protein 1-like [Mercenaria mercenaria]|uniref:sushi, von Willebrand factor type A, EGF and pentraxin domain-containing protein 1-like n=1 Tax=Mercenaria mercenaria TaxID=6596 RepID=UPI00234F9079|nr:sushi, von Willebrand factor type A, EGF and pentraxin domain-containing protein 1-like [Mercenaria mercenaria]
MLCMNSLFDITIFQTGPVPVVPFGRVSLIDDGNTTYGASANVICEAGFETNDLKIKCQRSGIWQTALCKAIDCGSPPAISFGNISLNADNNSTVGATAFVNCNENYVASRPKITCQSTGVWENVTCFSKGCSSIPTISNGKITVTGTTSVGSFANVTCDVGYEASVSSIKCQISRIWETAECKIKACGRVPAIKHGKVNLIDSFHTSVGDSANVVCDTGYETSKTKVACQSSGVWETALCTAKDCGPPPVISNGNITLSNDKMSTYGAEALVNCNDKYVANVSKIKCQSSGLWEVAQCAPEGQLNYDRCTEEHGVCTQHIYENIRLLALKSSKCRSFCHCAHAGTLIDGSVTYKWVERNCPQGTLFDDNLPSPVCNHPYMVWC